VVGWHVFRLTVTAGMDAHAVPPVLWPLGTARFGLDVFFALSGFLVVQSWNATTARQPSLLRASADYVRKRASRILPAYWAMLAVLLPLVGRDLFDHPERLFAFATLNQGVVFWLPERLNLVTWSLTTEWHFYLLVPLLAYALRRAGAWPVLAACTAASVLWWLDPLGSLPQSFVVGRLAEFAAGAVAAHLYTAHRRGDGPAFVGALGRRGVGIGVLVVLVAVGTYHGATLGLANVRVVDALVHPVVGIVAAIGLLHVVLAPPARVFTSTKLQWVGLVSFGVYLWHYPILEYGFDAMRAVDPRPSVIVTIGTVAVLVTACIAAGATSYAVVERPFLAHRNRPEAAAGASTLRSWPSRRSSASRPSTASHSAARPTPIPSSPRAS
jgi:peptidoglycan/LPS O-acetylase OafA/YrhL